MVDVVVMNATDSTAVDYAIPELWAKELIKEAEKQMFWKNYEGAQGSGMPIIRKDDLTKQAGDRIHVQTLSNLTGTGVTGTDTLMGNEEKLVLGQISIVPDWIRHAVAYNKDAKVKANFELRSTAMNALSYWLANKIDAALFTQAVANTAHIMYGGAATATASLTTGCEMSCIVLDRVKTALRKNLALPIKTSGGNQYYVIVICADDAYYLRQDSTWKDAQLQAGPRDESNPIFTGAEGVYNGMIVRVADNAVKSSANVSTAVAFGGEFMAVGYSALPNWNEEEQDYGFKFGVGTDVCVGTTRAVEHNTILVKTYAPAIS
jgi:N4-gp56 family major capsid protein